MSQDGFFYCNVLFSLMIHILWYQTGQEKYKLTFKILLELWVICVCSTQSCTYSSLKEIKTTSSAKNRVMHSSIKALTWLPMKKQCHRQCFLVKLWLTCRQLLVLSCCYPGYALATQSLMASSMCLGVD